MSIAQWWCRISPETWIHRRPEAVWIVPSLEETSFALPKRLGTDCKLQRINHFHRLIWPGGPSNSTLSVWAPWSTCWSGWCRAIPFLLWPQLPTKENGSTKSQHIEIAGESERMDGDDGGGDDDDHRDGFHALSDQVGEWYKLVHPSHILCFTINVYSSTQSQRVQWQVCIGHCVLQIQTLQHVTTTSSVQSKNKGNIEHHTVMQQWWQASFCLLKPHFACSTWSIRGYAHMYFDHGGHFLCSNGSMSLTAKI